MGKRWVWQATAQVSLQSAFLLVRGLVAENIAGPWDKRNVGFRRPTAMQLGGWVASLIIPTFAGRSHSQVYWTVICTIGTILGICVWLPLAWVGIATIILGLGLNAGFSMALQS